MRKIVMFNRVTPEGYYADSDGGLGWAVPDADVDRDGAAGIPRTDTILFGRRTYQMFESFWPNAVSDAATAPDPHAAGRRSPELRAMGEFINGAQKLVFSRTLKRVTWQNSRIAREFDPCAIEALKRAPGKDMIVFGSGSIVSLLTQHGLIDEYRFVVGPLLLGSGQAPWKGVTRGTRLELIDTKRYPSGNVMLSYARAE